MSEFQINFFSQISEIFIDGTFKVAPKNWYQLLNIFGYDKTHKFFMPLAFIILSSKSEEIYNEVFYKIITLVKAHTDLKSFDKVKIMSDFEIGLRNAIKNNFESCLLDGCYFHYCKAIWKKIKKLNLFKKDLRFNTIIISFIMKSYPFIKEGKREIYFQKIKSFTNSLGGNYLKLTEYILLNIGKIVNYLILQILRMKLFKIEQIIYVKASTINLTKKFLIITLNYLF